MLKPEDVEKDVIPMSLNKRESFSALHISFPWGYRVKKIQITIINF